MNYPFDVDGVKFRYFIGYSIYFIACVIFVWLKFFSEIEVGTRANAFFVVLFCFPFALLISLFILRVRKNDYINISNEGIDLKWYGDVSNIKIHDILSVSFIKKGGYVQISTKNFASFNIREKDFKYFSYSSLIDSLEKMGYVELNKKVIR